MTRSYWFATFPLQHRRPGMPPETRIKGPFVIRDGIRRGIGRGFAIVLPDFSFNLPVGNRKKMKTNWKLSHSLYRCGLGMPWAGPAWWCVLGLETWRADHWPSVQYLDAWPGSNRWAVYAMAGQSREGRSGLRVLGSVPLEGHCPAAWTFWALLRELRGLTVWDKKATHIRAPMEILRCLRWLCSYVALFHHIFITAEPPCWGFRNRVNVAN